MIKRCSRCGCAELEDFNDVEEYYEDEWSWFTSKRIIPALKCKKCGNIYKKDKERLWKDKSEFVGTIHYYDSDELYNCVSDEELIETYKEDVDCRGILAQGVENIDPKNISLRYEIDKIYTEAFNEEMEDFMSYLKAIEKSFVPKKRIAMYWNGNYTVRIYEDGTKVRKTKSSKFISEFAENIDVKICNRCDMNCKFCHEGSAKKGKLGNILDAKWVDTLKPHQEIAIGGGNIFEHPDLIPFLEKLKKLDVIANITVHQKHFEENQELIQELVNNKLIYGLGISLSDPTDDFIDLVKKYKNAVIHVINGIVTEDDIKKLMNHDLKLLILGYKDLRRGHKFYEEKKTEIEERQKWLYKKLPIYFDKFKVISFDNLAIEQLDARRFMTEKEWEEFYMGDDATFTYYIDTVEGTFSKSSTSDLTERYPLKDDVVEMFKMIKSS